MKWLKKGQVQNLPAQIIVLIVIIITLAIGALIVAEFQKQTEVGSAARNVTDDGLRALDTVGDFQSILGIVIIASVILALVVGTMVIFKQ